MSCSPVGRKLSAYATHQGSSSQTAWRLWQRGDLPAQQLPSGTVIVDTPPPPHAVCPQKVVVSARVASRATRKNLDNRAERVSTCCAARGWQVATVGKVGKVGKVVTECGSGVTDQRPHFLRLLADSSISPSVISWWNTRTAARALAEPISRPCSKRRGVTW